MHTILPNGLIVTPTESKKVSKNVVVKVAKKGRPPTMVGTNGFTRMAAQQLAKELRLGGASYSEIASELGSRGWRAMTGGPPTPGGIASLLGKRPTRLPVVTVTPQPVKIQATVKRPSVLDIVAQILATEEMAESDRIAACQLLLQVRQAV